MKHIDKYLRFGAHALVHITPNLQQELLQFVNVRHRQRTDSLLFVAHRGCSVCHRSGTNFVKWCGNILKLRWEIVHVFIVNLAIFLAGLKIT